MISCLKSYDFHISKLFHTSFHSLCSQSLSACERCTSMGQTRSENPQTSWEMEKLGKRERGFEHLVTSGVYDIRQNVQPTM